MQKPIPVGLALAATTRVALGAALAALVLDLAAFGLLAACAGAGTGSDSAVGTAARWLNAPGFLAAWFSPGGGPAQFAIMLAVNWACWFGACLLFFAVAAILRRARPGGALGETGEDAR
jgi:hypothetical protein